MPRLYSSAPTCFVLLALLLLGCEEDVTAVIGTAYPFEVYGYLDPTADSQFVRVFPVEGTLERAVEDELDALVATTDLSTGHELTWRDSVITYEDGSRGYLFWAPFRPVGGRTYRLEVRRSDGAASRADVRVPEVPAVLPPEIGTSVQLPVDLGDPGLRVKLVEVEYDISFGWCQGDKERYTFSYARAVNDAAGTKRVGIDLSGDYRSIILGLMQKGHYQERYGLMARSLRMRVLTMDAAWHPAGGVFDPEVLIEPGVLTNVENGFGYVGGGYIWDVTLDVPEAALSAAGFTTDEPTAPIDHEGICSRTS